MFTLKRHDTFSKAELSYWISLTRAFQTEKKCRHVNEPEITKLLGWMNLVYQNNLECFTTFYIPFYSTLSFQFFLYLSLFYNSAIILPSDMPTSSYPHFQCAYPGEGHCAKRLNKPRLSFYWSQIVLAREYKTVSGLVHNSGFHQGNWLFSANLVSVSLVFIKWSSLNPLHYNDEEEGGST